MTKLLAVAVTTIAILLCGLSATSAFVRSTTPAGRPLFWSPPAVTLDPQVGCAPNNNVSPWGQTCVWVDALKAAADEWNAVAARFTFTTAPAAAPDARPCSTVGRRMEDGYNSVGWMGGVCDEPFGPEVLAVTSWLTDSTGRFLEADVFFNNTEEWGAYTGPQYTSTPDFHRVALHELGHVLGLDHPDDYGQRVLAIMNARVSVDQLQPDDFAGIRAIYGSATVLPIPPTKGALENPGPNAFKSGIGVISGWVCEAAKVDVEIDQRHRFSVVYGTERSDTQGVCGDSNNGFVTLVNWNLLGNGSHTIRLLADDREVSTARFTVTTFGQEFLRGATRAFWARDFPWPGTDTLIEWEESSQNFVIRGVE